MLSKQISKLTLGICIAILIAAGCAFTCRNNKEGFIYKVKEAAVKTPKPSLVIMLHGVGSNEEDLFGLASYFPNDVVVVSARAPITLAQGSYAWFKIDRSSGKIVYDPAEADKSRMLISEFIDEMVNKYGVDKEKVFLFGFSQGAIMSYSVALAEPHKVKGIMALSGRLLPEAKLKTGKPDQLKRINAFIAHGTLDDVLPVSDSRLAAEFCKVAGIQVTFKEYKMKHQINDEEFTDLMNWFKAKK